MSEYGGYLLKFWRNSDQKHRWSGTVFLDIEEEENGEVQIDSKEEDL